MPCWHFTNGFHVAFWSCNKLRGLPLSDDITVDCHWPSYTSASTWMFSLCRMLQTLLIMNLNCELDKLLPFMPYPSGKLFGAPPVCSLSLQHMNIPNSVAWTHKTSWILLNTKLDSSDIIQAAWSRNMVNPNWIPWSN